MLAKHAHFNKRQGLYSRSFSPTRPTSDFRATPDFLRAIPSTLSQMCFSISAYFSLPQPGILDSSDGVGNQGENGRGIKKEKEMKGIYVAS